MGHELSLTLVASKPGIDFEPNTLMNV